MEIVIADTQVYKCALRIIITERIVIFIFYSLT